MNRRSFLKLPLLAPGLAPLLRAHKFHFSSALLEFDPESKVYQITVRLFADDLEAAIERIAAKPVSLDRPADAEPLAFEYLKRNLALRGPDMREIALAWVGLELKVNTAYIYLEAPAPETGLRDLAIRNSIFADLLPGQVNTVVLRDRVHGRPRDLVFRQGDRFKVVIFPEPDKPAAEHSIP